MLKLCQPSPSSLSKTKSLLFLVTHFNFTHHSLQLFFIQISRFWGFNYRIPLYLGTGQLSPCPSG